ncbi:RDD family protein [Nocardioides limicola]|uniref:RDD family protein n=1 Tax=Nocardioides limicola TaxID=2803368 RepID=UPI0027DC96BA|nr:RDD family protein [Nocardioides sp. DJM-14]
MIETASWARRVLALFVDWMACTLVVMLAMGPAGWSQDAYAGLYVLLVFAAESTILTGLVGGSFGKLMTRLRVVRHDNGALGVDPFRALLRSVLVCLVIPPLVFRPDGRGLHDMAAGSATVTLADLRAAR